MEGVIIKSTGSWYSVRLRDGKEVKARLPGRFKLENKKISNPIAVGDKVKLLPEAENYVIGLILPLYRLSLEDLGRVLWVFNTVGNEPLLKPAGANHGSEVLSL